MLARNLIANFVGQAWVAIIGLAFVPLYLRFLGVEAYGLIGLFAVMTACLSILDMGMSPTLGREMARFTAGIHDASSIRDLLRTIEVIAAAVAIAILAGVVTASGWLASAWLTPDQLPISVVEASLIVMGVVAALRFVETIYRSSLIGLQLHVLFNVVNAVSATVRGLGAVAILAWISPNVEAFFAWQALVSVLTLFALAMLTYKNLPSAERRGVFRINALRGVWRFAGGMAGLAAIGLLLTQLDKILLSKLLSLKDYGYYSLAALVASTLLVAIAPIAQALFPRLSQLHARRDLVRLSAAYHLGAQLVAVVSVGIAFSLITYAEPLLLLWLNDPNASREVAPILRLLLLGNLLHGLTYLPYQTQLAYGWTSLALKTNVASALIAIPSMYWAANVYGALGAAWVWVVVNAVNVSIAMQFMFRRILLGEKRRWYIEDIFLPLAMPIAVLFPLVSVLDVPESSLAQILLVVLMAVCSVAVSVLSASQIRQEIARIWRR